MLSINDYISKSALTNAFKSEGLFMFGDLKQVVEDSLKAYLLDYNKNSKYNEDLFEELLQESSEKYVYSNLNKNAKGILETIDNDIFDYICINKWEKVIKNGKA